MNILNTQVSYYPGKVTNTKSIQTVDLYDFITKPTPERISKVIEIRATSDPTRQKELKKRVDSITPSGVFQPERKAENLVKHSGIIALDFDADQNPGVDFDVVKSQVCRLSWVAACMYSIRGKGLVMYVPITTPDRHQSHFERLTEDFASFGLKVDPACSDVCRPRFDTYDPAPYINTTAQAYGKLRTPNTSTPHPRPRSSRNTDPVPSDIFGWACHLLENPAPGRSALHFVEGQRHVYIFRLCNILNDYGVSKSEAEAWIDSNLISLSEILTNCIDGPYNRSDRHGTKSFNPSGRREGYTRQTYTVITRPKYVITKTPQPDQCTTQSPSTDHTYQTTIRPNPIALNNPTPLEPEPNPDDWLELLRPFYAIVENRFSHVPPLDYWAIKIVWDVAQRVISPDKCYLRETIETRLVEGAGLWHGLKDKGFQVMLETKAIVEVPETDFFKQNSIIKALN